MHSAAPTWNCNRASVSATTPPLTTPNLPGELQTTIVLTPVCCDVEVHNMRQGIPLLTPALN